MPFTVGQLVQQHYLILGQLSRGGFGTIYLASDVDQQQLMVIKESNGSDWAGHNALLEEIKLLTRIQHPHLPRIYNYFQADDHRLCIVMEYILGENLENFYQRNQRPAPATAVAWMTQVLKALAQLHSHDPIIVHRDVKLGNIQIHAVTGQAYLLDFGIAKTGPYTILQAWTPPFAPPEQYRRGTTTPAADVYAVGVCLYILLTGQQPPDGLDRNDQPLVRPQALNAAIFLALEQVILRALEPNPAQRYPHATAMLEALQAMPSLESIADQRQMMRYRTLLASRRRRVMSALHTQRAVAQQTARQRALLLRRRRRIVGALRTQRTLADELRRTRTVLAQRRTKMRAGIRQLRELRQQANLAKKQRASNPLLIVWDKPVFRALGNIFLIIGVALLFLIPRSLQAQTFQYILLIWGSYPLCAIGSISFLNLVKNGWSRKQRFISWFTGCVAYSLFVSIVSISISNRLVATVTNVDSLLSPIQLIQIMIVQGIIVGVLSAGYRSAA